MEYNEYRKKLAALKAEIKELEKRYIDELPFHTNDKIKIKGEFVGWLLSVKPLMFDMIEIRFYPPKKNGEQSSSIRTMFVQINDIEVIND